MINDHIIVNTIIQIQIRTCENECYCICLGRSGAEREGPQERPTKPQTQIDKTHPRKSSTIIKHMFKIIKYMLNIDKHYQT
jgi:hypothetical protein